MDDSFLSLFVLFVLALEFSNLQRINLEETLFMVFALGFSLEKLAAIQEHGLKGALLRVLLLGFQLTLS